MVLTQFSECKVTRRSASILASLDTIVPSKYYTRRHVALQSWKIIDTIMAQTLSIENHLREDRARRGWSQGELARRSGLSCAGISAIETSSRPRA